MTEQDTHGSFKNWVGTLNNYTEDDIDNFREFCNGNCSYWIFQREIGENGTPHLQAYVCLSRKSRLTLLKNRAGLRWHWENRKGSHAQAKDYCSKEDTREEGTEPEEGGEEPEQGKRSDIQALVAAIKSGASDMELLEQFPSQYFLHSGKIERVRNTMHVDIPFKAPEVIVYYGETGAGKSRTARAEIGNTKYWKSIPGQGKWFDGYSKDCRIAWFDDYNGEVEWGLLLNLLDGYGTRVEVKGGTTWFHPDKIYITSNSHPDQWYTYTTGRPFDALKRRITKCLRFAVDEPPVVEWD